MVVGHGMLAKAFLSHYELDQNVIIFASGVSNSMETDPMQFKREAELLTKTRREHPEKIFVYFSSCSISDPEKASTPYVIHKKKMETTLMSMAGPHSILRLPAVIGTTNLANTFPYFLYERITSCQLFNVWSKTVRYPIDVDDVVQMGSYLITQHSMHNQVINVALRPYPVLDMVRSMERVTGKQANMNIIDRGCAYVIDRVFALRLADTLNIYYGKEYLAQVLRS